MQAQLARWPVPAADLRAAHRDFHEVIRIDRALGEARRRHQDAIGADLHRHIAVLTCDQLPRRERMTDGDHRLTHRKRRVESQ